MLLIIYTRFEFRFNVEVDPGDTVLGLKRKIEDHTCLPIDHQRLIFKGHALADEYTLQAIGLADHSEVGLVRDFRAHYSVLWHIHERYPADGDAGVPVDSGIAIGFKPSVQGVDIGKLFSVTECYGAPRPVEGISSYDTVTRKANFMPRFGWKPSCDYRVELEGAAMTLHADPGTFANVDSASFIFRTGGYPTLKLELVIGSDLARGSTFPIDDYHTRAVPILLDARRRGRGHLIAACARAFRIPESRIAGFFARCDVFYWHLEDDQTVDKLEADDLVFVIEKTPHVAAQMRAFFCDKRRAIGMTTMIRSLVPESPLSLLPNELLFEIFYYL